jgi:hypothetical protein
MLPQPPIMPPTYMPSQLLPTLKLPSTLPDLALKLLLRYNIYHRIDYFPQRIYFLFLLFRHLITGLNYIALRAILPLNLLQPSHCA